MTPRLPRSAPRLVLLALLVGCVWTSRPSLPTNEGQDAALYADAAAFDTAPPPPDSAAEDVPVTPDAPAPFNDAAAAADAPVADSAPPPMDGSIGADDCRFVPTRDGEMAPAGAVTVDGGYFANARGEGCDPAPRQDGGADAYDAAVTDAPRGMDSAAEGGRP